VSSLESDDATTQLAVECRSGTDPTLPPIVFVHGAMDRGESFYRVRRRLPEFPVVTYDRRGYNASLDVGASPDVTRHAADLARIIGPRPSIVVGHSFGGVVALLTAQEYPERIASLALYEPPTPWIDRSGAGEDRGDRRHPEDPAAAAEWFLTRMIGRDVWSRLRPDVRARRRAEGAALLGDLDGLGRTKPYDPSRLAGPVTVGHGSNATDRHRLGARSLADDIAGAELTTIEGAAHGAHLSHPDGFALFVRHSAARRRSVTDG